MKKERLNHRNWKNKIIFSHKYMSNNVNEGDTLQGL